MVDCTNNGLSARVDVNVLNDDALLSSATKLGQCIDLRCECFRQAGNCLGDRPISANQG
jgi:hypothetical protein